MTELGKLVEISGSVFGFFEVYLRIKQNVLCWLFALLGTLLYIYIFFDAKLYADAFLQFYYLIMTIYGWYYWKKGGNNKQELKVSQFNKIQLLVILIVITLGTIITGYILLNYTDDPYPYGDAFTTVGAIIGTWMMARKKIENWLIWIVVDAVCVIIYYKKGLYPTTILYSVFTIMATLGYIKWKKDLLINKI